jgi:hypothetical protein
MPPTIQSGPASLLKHPHPKSLFLGWELALFPSDAHRSRAYVDESMWTAAKPLVDSSPGPQQHEGLRLKNEGSNQHLTIIRFVFGNKQIGQKSTLSDLTDFDPCSLCTTAVFIFSALLFKEE